MGGLVDRPVSLCRPRTNGVIQGEAAGGTDEGIGTSPLVHIYDYCEGGRGSLPRTILPKGPSVAADPNDPHTDRPTD